MKKVDTNVNALQVPSWYLNEYHNDKKITELIDNHNLLYVINYFALFNYNQKIKNIQFIGFDYHTVYNTFNWLSIYKVCRNTNDR